MNEEKFIDPLKLSVTIWENVEQPHKHLVSYNIWLIKQQLKEMWETGKKEKEINEWADIIIIASNNIKNLGYDPTETVVNRILNRHKNKTDEIIKKYSDKWNEVNNR